jgi:transposase
MDLTDAQWKVVETILPEDPVRDDGRGRPWSDRGKVLNGVLRIMRTGAPWQDMPERLIGDKAYDSDRLDKSLMQHFGTEMIAPNRAKRGQTQDDRPLRRYVRRWKIERLFAWLFNFRGLVVRYEYHAENVQGFLHLGAAIILLRYL